MLIRCEMLKKLANAFIEVAKEENLPVNITMGRSYTCLLYTSDAADE